MVQVIDVLLLKIGADLGLFQKLVDSEKPLSLKDLATTTGADEVLLARIMRGLTSIDAVDEPGVELYAPNKVTRAFTTVKATSGLDLLYDSRPVPVPALPWAQEKGVTDSVPATMSSTPVGICSPSILRKPSTRIQSTPPQCLSTSNSTARPILTGSDATRISCTHSTSS